MGKTKAMAFLLQHLTELPCLRELTEGEADMWCNYHLRLYMAIVYGKFVFKIVPFLLGSHKSC